MAPKLGDESPANSDLAAKRDTQEATTVPRYIGEVTLSQRHQYRFRLYLLRARRLRIGRPPRRGPTQPNTTLYQRLHRAPWLLTTSLPHGYGSERRVMQLYRQRMQIEETFRDLKCHRRGFGLRLVGLAARALQLNPAPAGQHRAPARRPLHLLHRPRPRRLTALNS
jgi:hypothetical protein